MSLDLHQLTYYVVNPVLKDMQAWSPAAVILVLGTAMVESRAKYLHQINGPALGIYQMEPATHDDIVLNFLSYRSEMQRAIRPYTARVHADEMIWNLAYATAMCRAHYYRVSEPMPLITAEDMARYHKKYYNTVLGATNVEESTPVFGKVIDGGYA